ncbi:MAG: T9SS type A sorting domain-containing protein, partial [Bacteroides sp.]|nr:T9SS type A sorting domain-containing protein [Bacteroides sp.]
ERSEARFASDYLGGKAEDYDVIKVNTEDWQYRIEATDGDMGKWYEIWDMSQEGFSSNEAYYKLEGKDAKGNPMAGGEVFVDIDNLIDYMLSIFYTGNFDAPTSSFGSNAGPNNFFAITDRTDKSTGFIFFNHDAEHSMFSEAASPGIGLNEDRVNLADNSYGPDMYVSNFSAFHPQWLHHKLTDNAEYRIRFMDLAHERISGKGVLSTESNLERLNERVNEIYNAMIAESARWGDSRRGYSYPFTRDDNWIPEVDKIRNDFIPFRTNILENQLVTGGLLSELEATEISKDGVLLEEKIVYVDGPSTLLIKNPNSSSTIYYTTDGSDPRMLGGYFSPGAISGGTKEVEVVFAGSGILKTRIHYGGDWSPLKEIDLISNNEDYSKLVITELHYHPDDLVIDDDTTKGKDMEFIEFKNIGSSAIALGGLVLDSAIYYEFPAEGILAPGQFHVAAAKPSKFYLRYGMQASGNFQKNCSNGGEQILLNDPHGNPLINFTYSDAPPWPTEPDGEGNSLVSAHRDPTGNPAEAAYWTKSYDIGGSPFANEPTPASIDPDALSGEDIRVYPNPTSDHLNIELPAPYADQPANIKLYGINGNLVHQVVIFGNSTIQLSGLQLSSGVYLLQIQTEDQVHTRKIVFR